MNIKIDTKIDRIDREIDRETDSKRERETGKHKTQQTSTTTVY